MRRRARRDRLPDYRDFERAPITCITLAIVALDTLTVRLVFPTAAVGMALLAEAQGWGLFQSLPAPAWLAVIASVIALDLATRGRRPSMRG